jgi:succinate dehydrogenase (ubiquinone) membrane anchor subunit
MTIAAFATSGTQFPLLDGLLGVSLVIHTHIGVRYTCLVPNTVFLTTYFQFDSVLVDYVHKRKFPVLASIATWTLRTATVATLVGIYQFNTNDIGRQYSLNCLFPC